MIITDIQKQKHNEKRFSVFLDGEYAFSVTDIDLLYYKLKVGENITSEKVNEIIYNNAAAAAKKTALNFLGYRMRSRKEIVDKLRSKEYSDDIIKYTLEFLENYGYVNDREFAEAYIKDKKNLKGFGSLRIRYELSGLGIDDEILGSLEDLLYDKDEDIIKVIEKRLKGRIITDRREMQKLYSYLYGRGFPYERSKEVFQEYIKNIGEDIID